MGGGSAAGPIMSSSSTMQPGWGGADLAPSNGGSGISGLLGGASSLMGGASGGQQAQPQQYPNVPGGGGGGQGASQVQISQFPWLELAPIIRKLAHRDL